RPPATGRDRSAIVGCRSRRAGIVDSEGRTVIAALNALVELVEDRLTDEIDVAELTTRFGTTEYHVRRMFSSLAGMPLSEYIRRRRMTVAAADILAGGDVLSTAVLYGYGSAEAFGRA